MIKPIFFSVVIPLYNKEAHIRRAVDSVLSQSHEQYELIVVDDGSTDAGSAIVEQHQDERISLIRQKNKGVSAARNAGAKAAIGEFVCFLDADDAYESDCLATFSQMICSYPEAHLYTVGHRRIGENGEMAEPKIALAGGFSGYVPNFIEVYNKGYGLINSSSVCFRRDFLLQRIGGFPEGKHRGEDVYVWLLSACLGKIASTTKRCSIIYRNAENRSDKQEFVIPYHIDYFNLHLADYGSKAKQMLRRFLRRNFLLQISGAVFCGQRGNALRALLKVFRRDMFLFFFLVPVLLCPRFIFQLLRRYRNKP